MAQWDPLGLGANEERLTWFAEAERVHSRWAMLAVAGILVQVSGRPGTMLRPSESIFRAHVLLYWCFFKCLFAKCPLQEIVKPDIFWYDAPTKIDLPFNIVGLVLFELVCMHWVETKVRKCRYWNCVNQRAASTGQ